MQFSAALNERELYVQAMRYSCT